VSRPSRPIPHAGMTVGVVHLGTVVAGTVEEVREGGRTLVVDGRTYTLRRLTGHFVREDQPYYGTRLSLRWGAGRR
jgi:hypothetical protein